MRIVHSNQHWRNNILLHLSHYISEQHRNQDLIKEFLEIRLDHTDYKKLPGTVAGKDIAKFSRSGHRFMLTVPV